MYYPTKNAKEVMRINGGVEKLGNWNKAGGPIKMDVGQERVWLTGQKVSPWDFVMTHSMADIPEKIEYKYSIINDEDVYAIWEREPSREIRVQDPSTYKGELGFLGNSMQMNVNEVFVVNGLIDKADANFVGDLSYNEITGINIFIGPYPQNEEDADTMAAGGVTGVINLQTEIDIDHRGYNWVKLQKHYKSVGITPHHFPIHDFNEEDLKFKLLQGAILLNKMINEEGLKVYVHCTAGMGRAPALVLVYMCIFLGYDPDEADLFVKKSRSVSVPNLRAVKEVVAKHLAGKFEEVSL
mmetsp:Transcript_14764/g.14361  ORF Transcript_14764/g.14361 Transcript_14764/m.14361 type:complete len:297 (-) Transcript_14764:36-926(-)